MSTQNPQPTDNAGNLLLVLGPPAAMYRTPLVGYVRPII